MLDRPLTPFEQEFTNHARERLIHNGCPRHLVDVSIATYLEIRREVQSTAIREAIASKKARGRKHNKSAGYGFRWSRNVVRVPDESQRQAMARILAWRKQGYSWQAIAATLLRAGFRLPDGREWSVARCRRAVGAAAWLRLQGELPTVLARESA